MTAIADFVRLLRYAQARMAVAYHHRDLERARVGLAKAYAAHDAALADLRAHEGAATIPPEPPRFLLLTRPIKPKRRATA